MPGRGGGVAGFVLVAILGSQADVANASFDGSLEPIVFVFHDSRVAGVGGFKLDLLIPPRVCEVGSV